MFRVEFVLKENKVEQTFYVRVIPINCRWRFCVEPGQKNGKEFYDYLKKFDKRCFSVNWASEKEMEEECETVELYAMRDEKPEALDSIKWTLASLQRQLTRSKRARTEKSDSTEFCFDLMDNTCERTAETCWFRHDLPPVDSEAYKQAVERKEEYLREKASRTYEIHKINY